MHQHIKGQIRHQPLIGWVSANISHGFAVADNRSLRLAAF